MPLLRIAMDDVIFLALVLCTCALPRFAHAQDISRDTDNFMNAMTTCAMGARIEIHGDLSGSLRSFYQGIRTTGNLTSDVETTFLGLFPDSDRKAAYELYTKCIGHALAVEPGRTFDPSIIDREYFAYRTALACINSSCVFENCLAAYTTEFPFGAGGTFLRAEAGRAGSSQRCRPSDGSSNNQRRCVNFNGHEVCG
jgi:hypothetical protein